MPLPKPEPGLVISYAYLWHDEARRGLDEGLKDRPCAIVLVAEREDDGETVVTVVPVTHTPPQRPEEAVEIPAPTKSRLGLDDQRSWIVVTEINRFVWPGPDLRPVPRSSPRRFAYGFLPPKLYALVRDSLENIYRERRLKPVPRGD